MKKFISAILLIGAAILGQGVSAFAQDLTKPEDDPIITNRIAEWQDLKFGFMMHWGMYSQWGVVESWSICNEDWIDRGDANYIQYKNDYQALNKTFNPVKFNPDEWAALAKEAGMKYVVFTTKHHDGFCMYDTKETTYSTVDASCPFSKNKKADITGEIVKAFRNQGFWTGLYFSKADWHHEDYWAEQWATPDRNVNYDPQKYPERWQRFSDFTYNQIKELTHNYGDIDILWLDGGWIRPEYSIDDETRPWLGCKCYIQDIDMPKIAAMARENNPDLIIVDRSVHGKYENYQTPEQQVPDTLLPFPWETCMSMGNSWSYVENDNYKTTNKIIHLLVDIVAKGGNYLLNVGPSPEGELPPTAVSRMHEIGKWMKINGNAIYKTRPIYPYCSGKWRFTQIPESDNGEQRIYAFYLLDGGETLPQTIDIKCDMKGLDKKHPKILGCRNKVSVRKSADGYLININGKVKAEHAVVFEF